MLSVISDDKVSQWSSQRILMRVDYNCPMSDGRVTDATRIDRTLAGIKRLTDAGASVILMSHFGRPKGARQAEMSLAPVRWQMIFAAQALQRWHLRLRPGK